MIKPGDELTTKDGRKTRIYAVDGMGIYPIHGAIFFHDGWNQVSWTKEGKYFVNERTEHSHDLDIKDWKEDIPWDCIKDEIEWVTRDKQDFDDWWGWTYEPERDEFLSLWKSSSEDEDGRDLEGVKMPKGPENWREAIAQRPK